MKVFTHAPLLVQEIENFKRMGQVVACVPTMGKIHEAHLELVRVAKRVADVVIVSIFVNPKQFSEGEDYESYPRTFEEDSTLLQGVGTDMLYHPKSISDVYGSKGFNVKIIAPQLTDCLCGATRPDFFPGVMAVIYKLFSALRPDVAVFGNKDYQQVKVVQNLVDSFDLGVEVVPVDTVRNKDGVALSSRNAYLSEEVLGSVAPLIYKTLYAIKEQFLKKQGSLEEIIASNSARLVEAGFEISYLQIRREIDLSLVSKFVDPKGLRAFFGGYLEDVRLVDNLSLT